MASGRQIIFKVEDNEHQILLPIVRVSPKTTLILESGKDVGEASGEHAGSVAIYRNISYIITYVFISASISSIYVSYSYIKGIA